MTMRSIYLALFLLMPCFLFAQEGLTRTWFLTELLIDGNSVGIPNEEFQEGYPTISFSIGDPVSEHMGIGICNGFIGMIGATDTVITIIDFSATLAVCETSEEINFEAAYFNFLGATENQDFSYSIASEDNLEGTELTLTNSNGDQAIYGAVNGNPPQNLTQEGWYLDYFEIDGVAQNYPTQQEGQLNNYSISYFGSEAGLSQEYLCFYGGGGVYSVFDYFGTPTISIGGFALLAMDCGIENINNYDSAFTTQLENKTHTYEIVEEGQGRRLVLTDLNGDRVFYTNDFLSTEEFNTSLTVHLSPNPTQNNIEITGEYTDSIQSYQIIDMKGSVIISDIFSEVIDVKKPT
ncbi:MAG: heat shock protein HslJ [Dokdonia sp.]|jgi:heat shock protein HslJ